MHVTRLRERCPQREDPSHRLRHGAGGTRRRQQQVFRVPETRCHLTWPRALFSSLVCGRVQHYVAHTHRLGAAMLVRRRQALECALQPGTVHVGAVAFGSSWGLRAGL
jgi:hypothetical protein